MVIPSGEAYLENQAEIDSAVRDGAVALFLTLPPGVYRMGKQEITVRVAGMGPRHFVSGATGHPWVEGFGSEDFKFWHFASLGHPAPIQTTVLEGKGWNTVYGVETVDGNVVGLCPKKSFHLPCITFLFGSRG